MSEDASYALHAYAHEHVRVYGLLVIFIDQEPDIQNFVLQLSTCFKLLIPSQDVFDVFDDKLFSKQSQGSSEAAAEQGKSS